MQVEDAHLTARQLREPPDPRPPVLLSIDLEDWEQLALRSQGDPGWVEHRSAAFGRQVHVTLAVLEQIGATATFFVLGATAERHPDLVRAVAERGHEVASHGYGHDRVRDMPPDGLRADLERSGELIEGLSGGRPVGYRAPAFSIDRSAPWAYEVLADLGFLYDSSQYDSPRVKDRLEGIPAAPYRLRLPSGRDIWELPVAVWRAGGRSLPVGGGSYWRLLPARVLSHALRRVRWETSHPMLYFHPYELDPRPLRPPRSPAAGPRGRATALLWRLWFNAWRSRVARRLRAMAGEFRFSSYKEAHEHIAERYGAGSRSLSPDGVIV